MRSEAPDPHNYIESLADDRKAAIEELRKVILDNLPAGFIEEMSYGMIGYVVPHSLYPSGYHCDPKLPLPFLSIASQKNFVARQFLGTLKMRWLITSWRYLLCVSKRLCTSRVALSKSHRTRSEMCMALE